jgi:hypothetical protein
MNKNSISKIIEKLKDNNSLFLLAGIVTLVVQGAILTHNLSDWVDIRYADESMYLWNGLHFFTVKLDPSWGPVYSLWYFFLGFISRDPINLYYLNYKLMTIIPTVLLLIYLNQLTKNSVLSFFFSYLFLTSTINLPTWPRVSHFVLIIILTALILIVKTPNKKRKLIIASFALLITAYIRPEFALAFSILFIISLILLIKKKLRAAHILPLVICSIIMVLSLGIPYSLSRNLMAFGQGYEKNIDISERVENGEVKNYPEIVDENFGKVNSFPEIILNDRDKFFNHLGKNLKRLPNIFPEYKELILPINIIRSAYKFTSILFLVLFCSIPFVLFFTTKKENKSLWSNIIPMIGITIFLLFPSLIAPILYFPRAHYFLLLVPFMYTYFSPFGIFTNIKNKFMEVCTFIFIIFLSFVFLPNISFYFNKTDLPNQKTISYLKKLNIKNSVNIFVEGGGLLYYLGNNFKPAEPVYKPFDSFLRDKKIDIVVPSKKLIQTPILRTDTTWFGFLNNYGKYGFKKIIISKGASVYLKEGL